ncbi:serine/threonine protein kinase [Pseudenhygromyxa sp. WMMC2535]|uniref:serine/threonine-protein kinase n=1 Tax=Pseudenhygromyxa sp. WMMC2535 TaxID=2712867 RepID=UPI0015575577|nr:serine/threonine-protein kinase [Pseudenhygromyxa sp. WMMC2535]NVB37575.1 serine/threonine protein kinase [Pseudenhygromyxa sp. WMMC2535]
MVFSADRQQDETLDEGLAQDTIAEGSEEVEALEGDAAPETPRLRLEPGEHLGRFCVLEHIGEGGMGVVVAALDEQLDRKVALKFLTRASHDGVARERLVREARSLARLTHPNIVSVYEVGEARGVPYLAMELISGRTLRAWLERGEDEPAPTRLEILRMFLAAGRGLAAAHELGVVHRDFKPDNVLVDVHGRPRVVDFGLARVATQPDEPHGPGPHDPPSRPSVSAASPDLTDHMTDHMTDPGGPTRSLRASDTSLTRTGALIGTPAYMAPEQWSGIPADARSDQFAFCVALFSALYARAPFSGATMPALMQAVLEGEPAHIPKPERVPTALHQAILRGLSKLPIERWPSLEPLLQHIEDALASAQPGLFEGRPGLPLRVLTPLFWSFPAVWLGLESADVVSYTAASWAAVSGAQAALMITTVLSLRGVLSRHLGDPRALALPVLISVFLIGHRLIAWLGGAGFELMFAYDFLAIAGVAAIIVYLVDRRLWPIIALNLGLSTLATLRPGWAPHLWAVFSLVMPPVAVISLLRTKDRLRTDATMTRSALSSSRRSPGGSSGSG